MKWLVSFLVWLGVWLGARPPIDPQSGYVVEAVPTILVAPSPSPTLVPTKKVVKPTVTPKKVVPTDNSADPWGVSKQVGEHTWTMKVGQDEVMATPKEIWTALNDYRVRKGSQQLAWDEKLANYAQERANYLFALGGTDEHKGFENFLKNENGFEKLGFTWLGENLSYGYKMNGVHLVEWIYAGDKPHDDNQLNNRWNYVGIAVKGTVSVLIFGTGKE